MVPLDQREEPPMPPPATTKQEVEQLLEHVPDTSTLEDIQCRLYVLEKIKRDRSDIANGRTHTAEEARARLTTSDDEEARRQLRGLLLAGASSTPTAVADSGYFESLRARARSAKG
jgi:hypothetical protein